VITINVKNDGYSPTVVHAKAGIPIQLQLVSTDVSSCARSFVIPSLGIQQLLDATGEVFIEISAQEKGTKIPFSCSMGMYSGTIIFDL
jgi:plastocyanin domain-containing protein